MKKLNEQNLRKMVRKAILSEAEKIVSYDSDGDGYADSSELGPEDGYVGEFGEAVVDEDGNPIPELKEIEGGFVLLPDGRKISPTAVKRLEALADKKVVDQEATKAEREVVMAEAEKYCKGVKPGWGLSPGMTREKARELADKLYNATKGEDSSWASKAVGFVSGGLFDGGMGTNEEMVQEVFEDDAILSRLDLSYLCYIYEKETPGGSVLETIKGEYGYFSSDDFVKNVKRPLSDVLEDDIIFDLDGVSMTSQKLQELQEAEAELRTELEKAAGDRGDALGAAGEMINGGAAGLVTLAGAQMATGALVAGKLAVNPRAPTPQLAKVARALGTRTRAARSIGYRGAGALAHNLATGGGRAFATRIFAGTVLRGAVATLAIPGLNLFSGVILAGSLVFLADDLWMEYKGFTDEEASLLTGELYKSMNKAFKQACKDEKARARSLVVYADPDPDEVEAIIIDDQQEQEKQQAQVQYPVLPPEINGPGANKKDCIRRAQAVMNQYVLTRSLQAPQIAVDGIEGPQTLRQWTTVCTHILQNHSILSQSAAARTGSVHWPNSLSPALVATYPGYSPDSCGWLRFILDGYYNNVQQGTSMTTGPTPGGVAQNMFGGGTPAVVVPPPPGSGTPEQDLTPGEEIGSQAAARTAARGKLTHKNVIIGARSRNPAYSNIDFLSQFNKPAAEKMAMELIRAMKKRRLISGRPGFHVESEEVYNLSFKVKRNGTVKVKKFSGPLGDAGRFEKPHKVLEDVIASEMSTTEDVEFLRDAVLSVTFPPGFYTSTTLSEAAIRKAVRKAILRNLIS